MRLDALANEGIGPLVETPVDELRGADEELVGLDAQSVGQAMDGSRMGSVPPVENARDRPPIQTRPLDHLPEGKPLLGHDASQVLAGMLAHGKVPRRPETPW